MYIFDNHCLANLCHMNAQNPNIQWNFSSVAIKSTVARLAPLSLSYNVPGSLLNYADIWTFMWPLHLTLK